MKDTMWGRVTFNNEFARNDISCIGFTSIKKMVCRCSVVYKNETWYVYQKEDKFYVCTSRSNKIPIEYDLNFESTRKPFYLKECVALINAYHKGNILFAKFRMYDVIIHFKKFFEIMLDKQYYTVYSIIRRQDIIRDTYIIQVQKRKG